ncbi:MAG: hypothetical protein ACYS67_03910 [Planctomycetota bacterium]|jgi:hypothetical protein
MKYTFFFISMLLLLYGCKDDSQDTQSTTGKRTVICFASVESFEPQSGKELMEAFNSAVPFDISPQDFVCKAKSSGLTGWAVVSNDKQKDQAKEALNKSSKLKLLQVEALSPEFEAIIKKEWKNSQDVKPGSE